MQRPRLNHFHTYAEYTEFLLEIQKEYSDIMTLDVLATTEDGYNIWGVTLCTGRNRKD